MRWLVLILAFATACSAAHKQPTGPAPEYEDAPPPSWLKNAGPPAATPVNVERLPAPPVLAPPLVPTDGGAS